jgi:hypothetical protein
VDRGVGRVEWYMGGVMGERGCRGYEDVGRGWRYLDKTVLTRRGWWTFLGETEIRWSSYCHVKDKNSWWVLT